MEIWLGKGETLQFDGDSRGLGVRCTDGVLWVTQQGDGRDHLLKPGDRMDVSLRGKVIILACAKAALKLEEPRQSRLPLGRGLWAMSDRGRV